MKNSNNKQTRQTAVTSLCSRAHALALCALTLVCSTALAPILPVQAQTCMTESLLYTYDDEPAVEAPARHKVSKKTAMKKVGPKIATKTVATKTVETVEVAAVAPVHIAESSLPTMRNHP